MFKINLKAAIPWVLFSGALSAAAYWYRHRNGYRGSYDILVEEAVTERLSYAEKELFETYPRYETRRRLDNCFSKAEYAYLGNVESLDHDLFRVDLALEDAIDNDPAGALAYYEAKRVIQWERIFIDSWKSDTYWDDRLEKWVKKKIDAIFGTDFSFDSISKYESSSDYNEHPDVHSGDYLSQESINVIMRRRFPEAENRLDWSVPDAEHHVSPSILKKALTIADEVK